MFIQTEVMPDTERLKFLPGRQVLAAGTLDLCDKAQAAESPLAERLFAIAGVSGVSLGIESITVTKASGDWQHLKPAILGAIMEHFMSGAPVLHQAAASPDLSAHTDNGYAGLARDVWAALRRVIDPELGYNIVDLGLVYDVAVEEGGVGRITMTTTTPGCPATSYLQQGAGDAATTVPGIASAEVKLTYEPRWAPELMSPEAKEHFGIS